MVDTKPFWNDGTRTTNTASLCQKLGGLTSRLFGMTNLHWKDTLKLQRERKELETRKIGYSRKVGGVEGPMTQRPDFVEAKRKMNRLHDEHVKETSEGHTPIHPVQRSRQRRGQQFEGHAEYDYQIDAQKGRRTYHPGGNNYSY